MWIYQKNEKGSALINVDHVSRFYVNKSAVYANIGDCDIERVIGLSSEEEANDFMRWLAEKLGLYRGNFRGASAEVVLIDDFGTRN